MEPVQKNLFMEAMIMKHRTARIPLSMALYFLVGLLCMASIVGCTDTKMVQVSKIADGDGKVTLSWDNVANASTYNIYYSDSPGVTKQNGKKIANVANPHTIMGLKQGKVYYFVVTASTNFGESKESEEISFSGK
ncbi:MAG: fibronectin type III domain-containing protein [Deltaproteobacteria bacterium]|nr:MAG: fibronectin type III domain-containing protein [Deltaproteobacteria bacterium]